MHFKLLVVFLEDDKTDDVIQAARDSGATGCTIINNARGEGLNRPTSFLGLTLSTQRDVLLLLVEEHLSRRILEHVCEIGEFDEKPGTGIAIQIDVEDAVGISHQAQQLSEVVEDQL